MAVGAVRIEDTKSSYEYYFKILDFNHRSQNVAKLGDKIHQITDNNEQLNKTCDEKMSQICTKIDASKISSTIKQEAHQQFEGIKKDLSADEVTIKDLTDQYNNIVKKGEMTVSYAIIEAVETDVNKIITKQSPMDNKIIALYTKYYNQLSDTERVGLASPPPKSGV